MAVAAKSIKLQESARSADTQIKAVDSTFEATASLTPELVVALCGPIGSPLHETADQINNALNEFGYKTVSVRLSELIRLNLDLAWILHKAGDKRGKYLI